MLYYLLEWIDANYDFPGLGVFRYITFRASLAAIFSLIISLLIGKWVIGFLKKKLIGETIRESGPESHKSKKGTPTMGGIIIVAAIVIPSILWAKIADNAYVWLVVLATLWMGLVGFADDYIKVFKKNKQGLKGKFKIMGQITLGLLVGLTMIFHPDFRGSKGNVSEDLVLTASPFLSQLGFANGDRLIAIDGRPVSVLPDGESNSFASAYTVERSTEKGIKNFIVSVSEPDRLKVSDALFGNKDIAFVCKTNLPFIKDKVLNYARLAFWEENPSESIAGRLIYVLVVIFIVTAVSNSVNITDGLDGLAAGTSAITALTLGVFAYISGNIFFADYLKVSFIPLSGELLIFCAAMVGACVGFLWYNTFPAQVFMGDTGSLALGSAVGVLALMVKKELLLPLLCGVFFLESLSVIIQVGYFRYTKKKYGEGRRIFKMAPVHHHFELSGLHESKIVTRFWILTIMLSILAFATLKLR
jgi:phospho-N-acetylmuramoyl-pentapeptide-transferase